MSKEWVLDVLADLREFAARNGLVSLAEELEDAMAVAATELAPAPGPAPAGDRGDGAGAGSLSRRPAAGGYA
ncbi:MAG: hypothetical protein D6832_01555 [Alphaproteobacteria bacterium]|nr:MAG: hypothetical protein D6832_01555 [Alphaproteobacteria bacterium]